MTYEKFYYGELEGKDEEKLSVLLVFEVTFVLESDR